MARQNWALIRPSSSAHMFSVHSNYMVWKRLQAHFCLDSGLELAWSEVTSVWDGLIRGSLKRTLVWPEPKSNKFFFIFFLFFLLIFVVSSKSQQQSSILIRNPSENLMGLIRIKGSSLLKKIFWIKVDQDVFMQSCLSSFIQFKYKLIAYSINFFGIFFVLI